MEKRARPTDEVRRWKRIMTRLLSARLGDPVSIVLTDNVHTMVSFRRREGRWHLRLHQMFLAATPTCLEHLADYLNGDVAAGKRVDQFIRRHRRLVRTGARRRVQLRSRGRHHDLAELLEEVMATHLDERVEVAIGWSRAPRRRGRRRSIRLGSWSEVTRTIRVHPALDHPSVPRWFVAFVVFHELLHVVEPAEGRGGRRIVHTRGFRAREASHPDYRRALAWERDNLPWLLAWDGGSR